MAVLVVDSWPDLHSLSLRLVTGLAIMLGFVAVLAVHLMRGLRHAERVDGPATSIVDAEVLDREHAEPLRRLGST